MKAAFRSKESYVLGRGRLSPFVTDFSELPEDTMRKKTLGPSDLTTSD